MASRIVEAGTVITRTRFLLATRVLKERPLWIDVAEAFPPIEQLPPPHKARQLHSGRAKTLSYTDDYLRRWNYLFLVVYTLHEIVTILTLILINVVWLQKLFVE